MTGVILAGGENKRIGRKKALLEIGGGKIIDRSVGVYKKIFDEILIITNTMEDYAYLGLPMFKDINPGKGSMGGIYTGLVNAASERVFFSACDMPFIDPQVISRVIGEENYDIVVPLYGGRLHPLMAVYTKSCLPVMEEAMKENRLKIQDIFPSFNVKEVRDIPDGKEKSFFNINTIEDYEEAKRLLVS